MNRAFSARGWWGRSIPLALPKAEVKSAFGAEDINDRKPSATRRPVDRRNGMPGEPRILLATDLVTLHGGILVFL